MSDIRIRMLDASIEGRFAWMLEGPDEYDDQERSCGPAFLCGVSHANIVLSLCAASLRALSQGGG